jgi:hypothetical protein
MSAPNLTRRAAILAAATLPAVPALASMPTIPAAGATVASMVGRAMALCDYLHTPGWSAGLSGDEADDQMDELGDQAVELFRRAADMPCRTIADAAAKVTACQGGDRYAGGGLFMVTGDETGGYVENRYLDDVARFLSGQVKGGAHV